MEEEYKQYERTIKKVHSFNWTPKYSNEFRTSLNKKIFLHISTLVFDKLGWDLVFQDENSVEAKRPNKWISWTEKITVAYNHGTVQVKSHSLGNEFWDHGRNSKRVKLFIYAFEQTEKSFDKESLKELEIEVKKEENWDDYMIPDKLPQPLLNDEPRFWIPLLGGGVIAVTIGFLVALFAIKGAYVLLIFEVGVAILLTYLLKFLIRISNFTDGKKLNYLIIGLIFIIYFSNQFFQYLIVLNGNYYESFGILDFINLKLKSGFFIESINLGWIGLLIAWTIQIVVSSLVGIHRIGLSLTKYRLERVPDEVVEFAYYLFFKNKTEEEVRSELSKKGWKNRQDQDEVFEAISAMYDAAEYAR